MNFSFKYKTIIIISPQSWSDMHISKHHYSLELAKLKCNVFFINPVLNGLKFSMHIKTLIDNPCLNIVQFYSIIPYWTKFKIKKLFNIILSWQIRRLRRKIGIPIDIVWDFDCGNSYQNFKIFKAKYNIFHPVDQALQKLPVDKKPHVIFSVSNEILSFYEEVNVPKYFINHGLSSQLKNIAHSNLVSATNKVFYEPNNPIKAIYVGNLMIPFLDHDTLIKAIKKHPHIEFHFLGPYSVDQRKYTLNQISFINFLRKSKNVILHGLVSQDKLIHLVNDADMFFMKYLKSAAYNGDNSHKVIEQLSTGKVILSNKLSIYKNDALLIMHDDREQWLRAFHHITINLTAYNSMENQKTRIQYAINNSYESQLIKIEHIINSL